MRTIRNIFFCLIFSRIERADIINGLFRRSMDRTIRVDLLDPKEPYINDKIRKRCEKLAIELGNASYK